MRASAPSANGHVGRDERGRFARGNPGGPGNPFARHVGQLRSALLEAVSADDMRAVAAQLVLLAREGDIAAIKVLFDRTLGKPHEADLLERLERLEEVLAEATTP